MEAVWSYETESVPVQVRTSYADVYAFLSMHLDHQKSIRTECKPNLLVDEVVFCVSAGADTVTAAAAVPALFDVSMLFLQPFHRVNAFEVTTKKYWCLIVVLAITPGPPM